MLDIVTLISVIIGASIALLVFFLGILEYKRENTRKRAEKFIEMRNRLKQNPTFEKIHAITHSQKPDFSSITLKEKVDLLGFFEELALMMNSGLIKKEVAYYMFGGYLLTFKRFDFLWDEYVQTSQQWTLLRDFANEMQKIHDSFKYNRRTFRF